MPGRCFMHGQSAVLSTRLCATSGIYNFESFETCSQDGGGGAATSSAPKKNYENQTLRAVTVKQLYDVRRSALGLAHAFHSSALLPCAPCPLRSVFRLRIYSTHVSRPASQNTANSPDDQYHVDGVPLHNVSRCSVRSVVHRDSERDTAPKIKLLFDG